MKAEPAKAGRGGGRKGGGRTGEQRSEAVGTQTRKRGEGKKQTDFLLAVLRRIRWVWLDNEQSAQKQAERERRERGMDAAPLEEIARDRDGPTVGKEE